MKTENDPLLKIKNLLANFENELEFLKAIYSDTRMLNPEFEEVSEKSYEEVKVRCWLHGATDVWERNELERWLYGDLPAAKVAKSLALGMYTAWRNWLKTAGLPKFKTCLVYNKKTQTYQEVESKEPSDTYYADDNRFDIVPPAKDDVLFDYIICLAQSIEDDGKGHRLEWRALKSFLNFLRKTNPKEQVAFIEHIIPYKMSLHYGKIIRLHPPEAYPLSEATAANILMELARRARCSRPDAQHAAIESLALCWLCIAASRIRLPKTLEMVSSIKSESLLSGVDFSISTTPTYGGNNFWRPLLDNDFSVMLISTLFGEQPLKISNRLCAFLQAVAFLPSKQPRETILQKPRRSLTRVLDEVIKSVKPNPEYGNITYLSFLSQPHIFGDH